MTSTGTAGFAGINSPKGSVFSFFVFLSLLLLKIKKYFPLMGEEKNKLSDDYRIPPWKKYLSMRVSLNALHNSNLSALLVAKDNTLTGSV